MLTERQLKEIVYILISFWGKNYLKKSSDFAFLGVPFFAQKFHLFGTHFKIVFLLVRLLER